MQNKKLKLIIFFIIIYMTCYSITALICLIDIWFSTNFLLVDEFISAQSSNVFISFLSCLFGSLLGAAILGFTSLHRHIKNFDSSLSIGYFLSPILSISLGVLAFCLVQASFVFLSGNELSKDTAAQPPYGFAVFGFIFGYNWHIAIALLDKLSKKLQITSN
ncbi:hypothetical protein [Pseudoalteromonas spongiae]|uniref:hypothetical protein n=1 Tax=Pseudoalteromonas spongiae TaxID=298657 RepID=UPI00026CB344|nr:hypothetical protein [Pseudoalteromonas spongiae]